MIFYLIFFGLIAWYLYEVHQKRKHFPPGPIPLPIIGNLNIIYQQGFKNISSYLLTNFGDISTIWVGSKPFITFNNFDDIQETFVKNGDAFAGRPQRQEIDKLFRGGLTGIIITDGPIWREHRRFALHTLRNFGLGRNLMQERVLNEVTWMFDEMKQKLKNGENEMNIQNCIDLAVGSIINSIIFGYSFHEKSLEEFDKVKSFIQGFIRMIGNPAFRILSSDTSGTLRKFLGLKGVYEEGKMLGEELQAFFNAQINERKQKINFDEDSEGTDYVEAYLRQQQKNEKNGGDKKLFSNEQLLGCVFDMWLAGQETTSNTLTWMILYLMERPEIQNKLQQEFDAVIGSDRIITLDDKINLPYTNAVIAETQRFCNLIPNNIPHRLTEDFEFHGYHLKADTIVVPQLSSVLLNEKFFPEPDKFKPERFIDANGKFQTKPELIPFGVGKRACLGEGLARLELYLFATNLFNQFKITKISSKPPNMTPIIGATQMPMPFFANVQQRL